jgi:hypothetical protein
VLQIDDDANQAVYGTNTTARMVFEGRAPQAPSNAVVAFRDHLEEATAAARVARGTGGAPAPAPVATSAANGPAPATTSTAPLSPPPATDPVPQPFEPVQDNPATVEPLPETP